MNIDFSDFCRISFRGKENESAQSFSQFLFPWLQLLKLPIEARGSWKVLVGTTEWFFFSITTSDNGVASLLLSHNFASLESSAAGPQQ